MNELKVRNHHDWEGICKYLASRYASDKYGLSISFSKYGSNGEKQHGVDLISNQRTCPSIVIQCKDVQKLTIDDVFAELYKTDNFPHSIDIFVVFTTASKHKSIQNCLLQKENIYSRRDGGRFEFLVYYWEDINPFEALPKEARDYYFPWLTSQISKIRDESIGYESSLSVLKKVIPKFITMSDLQWLENWDFYRGYVKEEDCEPFLLLLDEYNLAEFTRARNSFEFLSRGSVLELVNTLSAGERFYEALERLCNSIRQQAISDCLRDGTRVLTVNDLVHKNNYIYEMHFAARELAKIYREDIMGCSPY